MPVELTHGCVASQVRQYDTLIFGPCCHQIMIEINGADPAQVVGIPPQHPLLFNIVCPHDPILIT